MSLLSPASQYILKKVIGEPPLYGRFQENSIVDDVEVVSENSVGGSGTRAAITNTASEGCPIPTSFSALTR